MSALMYHANGVTSRLLEGEVLVSTEFRGRVNDVSWGDLLRAAADWLDQTDGVLHSTNTTWNEGTDEWVLGVTVSEAQAVAGA